MEEWAEIRRLHRAGGDAHQGDHPPAGVARNTVRRRMRELLGSLVKRLTALGPNGWRRGRRDSEVPSHPHRDHSAPVNALYASP
jgi:hypothetical protein